MMNFSGLPKADTLWKTPHFSSVSMSLAQQVTPIREGVTTSVDTKRLLVRWSSSYVYRMLSSADKRYMFDFWKSHSGAGSGFWMPSWLSDFTPSRSLDAGDTAIWVSANGFGTLLNTIVGASDPFSDPSSPAPMTFGLMVVYKNKTIQFRGISGYVSEASPGEDRIDLYQDSTSGGELVESATIPEVALLSLVRFVRMESGTLKLSWLSDNSKVDIPVPVIQKLYAGALSDIYET